MPDKRVLLMYIHQYSGHHVAALSLKKAFESVAPGTRCDLVDEIRYAHPLLERFIHNAYLQIVQRSPRIWRALYDNPDTLKVTQRLRRIINHSHSVKFNKLMEKLRPDAIVCTQAFPCGIASYAKAVFKSRVPVYGVLTDYMPHAYWPTRDVDRYFVATQEAKEALSVNGVSPDRVSVTGIPIDFECVKPANGIPRLARAYCPIVLVMGGSQGLGPIPQTLQALDRMTGEFEVKVLTGRNSRLYKRLLETQKKYRKKISVYPYLNDITTFIREAAVIISKPGGLTTAHALAAGVPIVFINPIPGQEAKNAAILLKYRAGLEAKAPSEAAVLVSGLLSDPDKIPGLSAGMATLAKPRASTQIAETVMKGEAAI
jgi:processive 1,2-diacylglycerol beta-glucosyltransferase